jgi:hypothetical protein
MTGASGAPSRQESAVLLGVFRDADPTARRRQALGFATWPGERMVECVPVEGGHLLWG